MNTSAPTKNDAARPETSVDVEPSVSDKVNTLNDPETDVARSSSRLPLKSHKGKTLS